MHRIPALSICAVLSLALSACDEEYYYEEVEYDQQPVIVNSVPDYANSYGRQTTNPAESPIRTFEVSPVRSSSQNTRSVPNAPFSQSPSGRFGVCNRYSARAATAVNQKSRQAVDEVRRQNPPPHVVNAHMTIIRDAHSQGMTEARKGFDDCVAGFRSPQEIVDIATLGFSQVLQRAGVPEGRVRIDASEIASGRPLGGNEALVPKAREQVLRGDRGTVSNIARDPIRCITFARKC